MRVSISTTLLITLSAHHYLSHALPLGLRARVPAPHALDYPVVDVAEPDVPIPNPSPEDNDDEDDVDDDVVTRIVTQESDGPTATPSAPPSESCITGGVVPVVGVKETGGAVRPTATPSTTRSMRGAAASSPTPSPIITPSPATAAPPGESSPSTAAENDWSLPAVILDPELEAEHTTPGAPCNTTPTPVPYGEGHDEYTTTSTFSTPLSTGSPDTPSYDESDHGGHAW